MHESSYEKMEAFVEVHLAAHRGQALEILDFGSQVVDDQGVSYKPLFDDANWSYRGLDIAAGHNVDITVTDAYNWTEIGDDTVDLVISGQAFEHVEYFWASMFEIVRALKPGGVAVIIAPSGGFEHRYPLDCWRFYRDGFVALTEYVGCELVDAFTDWGNLDWEDSIVVARKPVWDAAGRETFHRRSVLQRVLLDDRADLAHIEQQWTAPLADIVPSALASVVSGALTADLEATRELRLAIESLAATNDAQAAQEAQRHAVEREAELVELHAHVEALHAAPGPFIRAYGSLRSRIAGVVGERGRQLYKRLRGRA